MQEGLFLIVGNTINLREEDVIKHFLPLKLIIGDNK